MGALALTYSANSHHRTFKLSRYLWSTVNKSYPIALMSNAFLQCKAIFFVSDIYFKSVVTQQAVLITFKMWRKFWRRQSSKVEFSSILCTDVNRLLQMSMVCGSNLFYCLCRGQCYKSFQGRKLLLFLISQRVCPWQVFPAQSNV